MDALTKPGQAGVQEVTTPMVRAGVAFLRESGRLAFDAQGPDEVLVEDLLRRVFDARGCQDEAR